jgi:hypothetical protein
LKTKLDIAKTKMYALRDRTVEYADVPQTIYYKYATDGESLILYGLNRGETLDPGGSYKEYVPRVGDPPQSPWGIGTGTISDNKIETIYRQNPDTKQFWPIFQVFLDASNGTLTNDYGY